MRPLALSLAVMLLLGIRPAPLSADTASQAGFLRERARAAFADGRYDDALLRFLEANRISPSPRGLFNVAVTAQYAGEAELSFLTFQRYLKLEESDPDPLQERYQADARRNMAELAQSLALVSVETDPPGAQVFVDAIAAGSLGTSPLRVPVSRGAHTITARLDAHHDATREVQATVGRTVDCALTLPPRQGQLRVSAVGGPARVRVRRGGEVLVDQEAPVAENLQVGPVEVEVYRGDEVFDDQRMVIREGAQAVRLAVPPVVDYGRLLVVADPQVGDVYLDGTLQGPVPFTINRAPSGQRTVSIRAEGYEDATQTVEVVAEEARVVRFTLTR